MRTPQRQGIAGLLSTVLLTVLSCSTTPDPNREPEGWADDVELPTPEDLNPDPHILEIELVASVETLPIWNRTPPTEVYTFAKSIPGPLIELTAGDRLIVHFRNDLPEPTTIHWHGLRIDNEMDGAPNHPRPPIQPGESFDYDFVVPDAGFFWYHPHVNSSAQVGFGLYGPLLVRPNDDSEDRLPPDEVVLVLSDIGIDDDGNLVDPHSGGDLGALFGREGNVMLVNGKWIPTLEARSGVTQRWRLVNAARSRYFQLELPGSTFTRVGSDGGLMTEAVEEDRVLLVPGERADVLVTPTKDNGTLQFLKWIPFDRGLGSEDFRFEEQIMRIDVTDDPPGQPMPPEFERTIEPIDITGATEVTMRLTRMKDEDGGMIMGINGLPFHELEPFPATIGETQVWTIVNEMDWAHPFHLHGFFFQEIDENGDPVEPRRWLDSIDIPIRETRRVAVTFDERPGTWMVHCHILDHAEAGMMALVELVEP